MLCQICVQNIGGKEILEFRALHVKNWRQFAKVDLDLTSQVTILTGQNGCGKTTLLNLLNKHFGWTLNFVSTPYISKKRAKQIWSDLYDPERDEYYHDSVAMKIGAIKYSNGLECNITSPAEVSSQYQLNYDSMQSVQGMHIPSHRPISSYNHITTIPTEPVSGAQQYQSYQQLLIQLYGGGRVQNPGSIQKQSLISLALMGEGNTHVIPNAELEKIFLDFQEVLRKVLPKSLGFRRLEIRMPEVVLTTDTGSFSIDAMSGGINAIFSIAWQIYMYSFDKDAFTVTIDEPENHLHPSMQKVFLPQLADAFPRCRIIAATHSPFVVSSFENANVYALARNSEQRIESNVLDLSDISGTPNEVLREILDVRSTLPAWVEGRISQVIQQAHALPLEQRGEYIFRQLEALGLADAIVEYGREDDRAKST